jgi:hypothetical protein
MESTVQLINSDTKSTAHEWLTHLITDIVETVIRTDDDWLQTRGLNYSNNTQQQAEKSPSIEKCIDDIKLER